MGLTLAVPGCIVTLWMDTAFPNGHKATWAAPWSPSFALLATEGDQAVPREVKVLMMHHLLKDPLLPVESH